MHATVGSKYRLDTSLGTLDKKLIFYEKIEQKNSKFDKVL